MRLDDAYRLLELSPDATPDQVREAHRDLTKVWHPDRFAGDPAMRRKAEEKLKAINEAWETIRREGDGGGAPPSSGSPARASSPPPDPARRRLGWGLALSAAGIIILLRRPTPGGLILGLLLLGLGVALIAATARGR